MNELQIALAALGDVEIFILGRGSMLKLF